MPQNELDELSRTYDTPTDRAVAEVVRATRRVIRNQVPAHGAAEERKRFSVLAGQVARDQRIGCGEGSPHRHVPGMDHPPRLSANSSHSKLGRGRQDVCGRRRGDAPGARHGLAHHAPDPAGDISSSIATPSRKVADEYWS